MNNSLYKGDQEKRMFLNPCLHVIYYLLGHDFILSIQLLIH